MRGKTDPWNVSTVNILTRLKANPAPPSPYVMQDLKYTVLDLRYVYRDAQELAELHACDPRQLVNSYAAFQPERLALHEAIVGVTTTVRVEGEEEMHEAVKRVHQAVLQKPLINTLHADRVSIEQEAAAQVDAYLSDPETVTNPIVHAICHTVKNRPDGHAFGQYRTGYTERHAMVALATDKLFAAHATQQLKECVKEIIQNDLALTLITIPSQSARKTLMVTGGISSGKGSSVATIRTSAEAHGIEWRNIAKVNGDSLKPLLLDINEVAPPLFSQLAQEEASVLSKIKIKGELRRMIDAGVAPHMFFDQTRIEEDAKWGVKNDGHVIGLIVSTRVEAAIPRASLRGDETGRYEATQGITGNHKAVAEEFLTAFAPLAGHNAEFILYVNNGEKGSTPVRVMTIDAKNREMDVLDEGKLDLFVKKCNINPKATGPDDLYSGTKTRADYLADLQRGSGYHITLPLPDEDASPAFKMI